MNLTVIIESAEFQFKQILEEFFISNYDEKLLSSHDIDHHRRVWSYAKDLLTLFHHQNPSENPQLPSKLIIACYLHDIGMSVETGIRHGKHSRDLCVQFMKRNNLSVNDYQDVLDAIDNHDNKEYTGNTSVNDLLVILSVADDLDALGFTGIFRYSEIYLTRGIKPEMIGHLIKDNALKRFDHFMKTFGFSDELVQKHKAKFLILDNFFSEYNKQVLSYHFGEQYPVGYCGVVEMFLYLMNNKLRIKEFSNIYEYNSKDPVIYWFFNELKSEME